jgi:hypothetical protein
MDLLTVVRHEIGHTLGLDDLDPRVHAQELMSATLAPGVRASVAREESAAAGPAGRHDATPIAWESADAATRLAADDAPHAFLTRGGPAGWLIRWAVEAFRPSAPAFEARPGLTWRSAAARTIGRHHAAPIAWEGPDAAARVATDGSLHASPAAGGRAARLIDWAVKP